MTEYLRIWVLTWLASKTIGISTNISDLVYRTSFRSIGLLDFVVMIVKMPQKIVPWVSEGGESNSSGFPDARFGLSSIII